MCHHDPSRERADRHEALEDEDEPIDHEADDEHRLPPIPPSD